MHFFRLFLSSPKDASVERRRTDRVVGRLNGEFAGMARLETVRWETEHYQAHTTFQSQIPPATECDLVVGILKWRLGTELPPDFEKTADGEAYPSGTAYEILTSIEKRRGGSDLPDVFVFRFNGSAPTLSLDDPNRERIESEWGRLKSFFERWFITKEGHFLAAMNSYASEDDFEAQLEAMLRKWLAEKVAGGKVVRWPATKGSPFRGLSVFGAKHAPVFFGRSGDIRKASDLWRDYAARGERYLLIVGASGAGKSSLARSGLVPRIMTPGVVPEVDLWRVAVVRPGDSADGPLASLAAALMQTESDLSPEEEGRGPALPEIAEGDSKTPAELSAVLAHGEASAMRPIVNALARVGERAKDIERYGRGVRCDLVLLVDQLDELFAPSVTPEIRNCFADLLKSLVASGRVWVLATLRADLYQSMLQVPALKALKDTGASYDLSPPGIAELAEIVREPAKAADLTFETNPKTGERLDERLVKEADRPDMLPLVQLALSRLWEKRVKRDGETLLANAAFDALGGVQGIIEEAGEGALARLGATERSGLPKLTRKLAELSILRGGATTYTARAVPLGDAAETPAAKTLVNALVEARLLTLSGSGDETTVRLSHQRVLSDWPRAAQIVADSATYYRVRDEVEAQRRRWEAGRRRRELLLSRGLPLSEARSMALNYGAELSPETVFYIAASSRRANVLQVAGLLAVMIFAVSALLAIVEANIAGVYQREAEQKSIIALRNEAAAKLAESQAITQRNQALITQSRFLSDQANQAVAYPRYDAGTSILLALEALPDMQKNRTRPYVSEAGIALFQARQKLREVRVLQHADPVQRAIFSLDGKRIFTSFGDYGAARVWDAATGQEISTPKALHSSTRDFIIDPGGLRLVDVVEDTVLVRTIITGKDIILRGHAGIVNGAIFQPNGKHLVTWASDKTARIWNAETGQELEVLAGNSSEISSVVFSPDGTHFLIVYKGGTARIYEAQTRKELVAIDGHKSELMDAVFSLDGQTILTNSVDRIARVWDARTGTQLLSLNLLTRPNGPTRFSPDGRWILSAIDDNNGVIWDAKTGVKISSISSRSKIDDAAFSPDGTQIVTVARDDKARIWDTKTGEELLSLQGHVDSVWQASFSPDGRYVVTASEDGTARIWNITAKAHIVLETGYVRKMEISSDGQRVLTTSLASAVDVKDASEKREVALIQVWDTRNGQKLLTIPATKYGLEMENATFSPDSRKILTEDGEQVRIFDAQTGVPLVTLRPAVGGAHDAKFSSNGRKVVTLSSVKVGGSRSSGKFARVWDAETGMQLALLEGHTAAIVSAEFSPDGDWVLTASEDRTSRIWDAHTGSEHFRLANEKPESFARAVFSPSGQRILTTTNGGVCQIWDARTGKLLFRLSGEAYMRKAVFSLDGQRILAFSSVNRAAYVWDARNGRHLSVLLGHQDAIENVAFSPDGQLILTTALDGTARLWETETGNLLAVLDIGTGNGVTASNASFSPDGRHVLISTLKVQILPIYASLQALVDDAMAVVPRCLTSAQREKTFLDPTPPDWCVASGKWPNKLQR